MPLPEVFGTSERVWGSVWEPRSVGAAREAALADVRHDGCTLLLPDHGCHGREAGVRRRPTPKVTAAYLRNSEKLQLQTSRDPQNYEKHRFSHTQPFFLLGNILFLMVLWGSWLYKVERSRLSKTVLLEPTSCGRASRRDARGAARRSGSSSTMAVTASPVWHRWGGAWARPSGRGHGSLCWLSTKIGRGHG